MFLLVLEVKNKSRTAAQTKFGATNPENQKRITEQNFTTGLFFQGKETRALFTFAGLSRFGFSFSKNENSVLAEQAAKRGFRVSLW